MYLVVGLVSGLPGLHGVRNVRSRVHIQGVVSNTRFTIRRDGNLTRDVHRGVNNGSHVKTQ